MPLFICLDVPELERDTARRHKVYRTLSAGFAGQASRFLVRGSHTARDGAVVDAALNLFLGRNVSLRAEYLGGFSSSDTLHGVTLGLRGRFPWEAR